MMDDETVFQSSGQGPALAYSATGGMFGGEDAELNRAIEESLRSGAGASSSGAQIPPVNAAPRQAMQATHTSFRGAGIEEDDPELAAAIAASLEMEQSGPSISAPAAASNKAVHPADEDDEDFWKDQDAAMDDQDDEDDGEVASAKPENAVDEKKRDIRAQTVDEDDDDAEEEEEQEEKPPTAEELRAKRLARFG